MNTKTILATAILLVLATKSFAGISVDAGLTPAQDRWILRMQYRNMQMYNETMSSHTYLAPLVLAYGVTSNFTLMARGIYKENLVVASQQVKNRGFEDAYLLSKFKVYRKNTANYVFGVAPFLATNIPVGSKVFSSRVWKPEIGISVSFRPRFWQLDFTSSYTKPQPFGKEAVGLTSNAQANISISHLIAFNNNPNFTVSPVAEFSYIAQLAGHLNPSRTVQAQLFASPGIQVVYHSFVLEALYQKPVYQYVGEMGMANKRNLVLGTKIMF